VLAHQFVIIGLSSCWLLSPFYIMSLVRNSSTMLPVLHDSSSSEEEDGSAEEVAELDLNQDSARRKL
jgi:hypothetical protein